MTLEFPTQDNIDQIRALNCKYLYSNLSEAQRQNGFVRIAYSRDDLQAIIAHQEMMVAVINDAVVAYYLIGRRSGNTALDYQKNKALSLFSSREIPFEQIGYGCQVCIDEVYRNNGLFAQLLKALAQQVKDKYRYLLCSVSDDNSVSKETHVKNEWQLIDVLEGTNFYIFDTHKPIIY